MLEALLSAGTKLLGGFLGQKSQDEANEIAKQTAQNNINLQRQFAQEGIQWKVADAKAAGIHPLYALGASTTSFSPVSVGVSGASPLASALGDMGQDISRAAGAMRSDKGGAISGVAQRQLLQSNELDLDNKRLNNLILKQKLAAATAPGTPPGVAFVVPEKNKPEERPPLMIGGNRWDTSPGTSPMKAWEDQYGDDGPASWIMPWIIAAEDFKQNYGQPATWPRQIVSGAANAVKRDLRNEYNNARSWVRRYIPPFDPNQFR